MATASGVERKKNWTTRTLFFIVSLLFVWACFGLRGWGLGFFFSNNFCSWGSWKRLKRFEMMETETKTNQSIFRHVFWLFFFCFFFYIFNRLFANLCLLSFPLFVRSFIWLGAMRKRERSAKRAKENPQKRQKQTNQPTNPPPHPPIWAKRKKKKTQTTHKKKWNSKWKKRTTQTKHARFVSTWPLDWRWWLFF